MFEADGALQVGSAGCAAAESQSFSQLTISKKLKRWPTGLVLSTKVRSFPEQLYLLTTKMSYLTSALSLMAWYLFLNSVIHLILK